MAITFKEKIAIVTGGASGIGKSLSQSLAEKGCIVVIADIDSENGELAAETIKRAGGEAPFEYLDVTNEEKVGKFILGVYQN